MGVALTENSAAVAVSTRLFSRKAVVALGLGFFGAVVASNLLVRFLCQHIVAFDCPVFWPISEFSLRVPALPDVLVMVVVAAAFAGMIRRFSKEGYRIAGVVVAGVVLILGANLVLGWTYGFVTPMLGGQRMQYYSDAAEVDDPLAFVAHYEDIQPGLRIHAKTHPPGAVLTIYALDRLVGGNPGLVSVAVAIISGAASMIFLHGILSANLSGDGRAGYLTFLFALIPSVAIYYAASIDALIGALLLGALYCVLHPRPAVSVIGTLALLFLTSFLTFGFVFFLPVMAGFELFKRRSVRRSALVAAGLALSYVLVYLATGYNYANSFMIATRLENPDGFRLIAEPASYFFTRVEGVTEIVVFFGPYLSALALRGFRLVKPHESDLMALSWLGVGTLLAMLATGAFKTGETARVCLFLYPYLLFPVALYLDRVRFFPRREQITLSALVFGQTLYMQLFGVYLW